MHDTAAGENGARGRSRSRIRRPGFSLIEVLVALIIVSGMLAVLVPAVLDQVNRSQPTRIGSDLAALASGLSMFRANVLTVPDDIEDLANPIDAADRQLDELPYSVSQIESWRGPYLDHPMLEEGPADPFSPDSLPTGFKAFILPQLALFNSVTNDSLPAALAQDANYAALMISGLSDEEFEDLNRQVDGPAEARGAPGCVACSWDRGKLRRLRADGVAYYLVMPYTPR